MKALSFAQYFDLDTFEEMADYLDNLGIPCTELHKEGFSWRQTCDVFLRTDIGLVEDFAYTMTSEYHDYVYKPFKPELITELFEGWVKVSKGKYSNNRNKIHIYGNMVIWKYSVNNDFILPRTLDDFITDCQRAGIELIWKKQEASNV